jgi:DNA modification methylase
MNRKIRNIPLNRILLGDCKDKLKAIPDNCVDLIVTSPPYADNRKSSYKGIPMDKYVEWFLPITKEIKRVLKNDGSFVLNIKERAFNGERHTYVLDLITQMRQQGWLWVEEYIWHKKNSYPGKWPNRFRDSWERCLHFTKKRKFKMYQEAVMVPMGKWAEKRLATLSEKDKTRYESRVNSGFGKNISNWIGRDKAYPTNVLQLSTESSNKGHSATFPISLPSWFIRLFTQEDDTVLDPFMGSGTTALACIKLNRNYIGVELMPKYHKLILSNIKEAKREAINESKLNIRRQVFFPVKLASTNIP